MDMKGLPTFFGTFCDPPNTNDLLRYCMPQNAKKVLKISPWSWRWCPTFRCKEAPVDSDQKCLTNLKPGGRWNNSNLPMRRRALGFWEPPVVKVEKCWGRKSLCWKQSEKSDVAVASSAGCKLNLPLRSLKETHLPTMIFQGWTAKLGGLWISANWFLFFSVWP